GSTQVSIEFIAVQICWIIRTYATVLSNVEITNDLMWKVVALNSILEWGNLGIGMEDESSQLPGQGNGYVILAQSIVGDFVDTEEVLVSVKFVSETADELDDMMQQVFGGLRGHDFIEQMGEV